MSTNPRKSHAARLVARAEYYKAIAADALDKAQALMFAAAELDVTLAERAAAAMPGKLAKAIAVEHARNGGAANGTPVKRGRPTPADVERRESLVRAFLTTPRRRDEIRAHLHEHGVHVAKGNMYKVLRAMPDVRLRGLKRAARWSLKRPRTSAAE